MLPLCWPSAFAVTKSQRGPRAKSQRSLSASGAQLAQLETAAQQAQQAQQVQQAEVPSIADMLREGPSVVVVDEAHVLKTDTVRGGVHVVEICNSALQFLEQTWRALAGMPPQLW